MAEQQGGRHVFMTFSIASQPCHTVLLSAEGYFLLKYILEGKQIQSYSKCGGNAHINEGERNKYLKKAVYFILFLQILSVTNKK